MEALPQRVPRRRRRRRGAEGSESSGQEGGSAAPAAEQPAARAAGVAGLGETAVRPIPPAPAGCGFEYLDHTADIQLHSWGPSLPRAFEQVTVAMFAYMTELATVEVVGERSFTAEGHDLRSLLYNFMDECLYVFCTELFVCKQVEVEMLELCPQGPDAEQGLGRPPRARQKCDSGGGSAGAAAGGDRGPGAAAAADAGPVWRIRARGVGEKFELGRHPQGTEVKAITYSNMQIFDKGQGAEGVREPPGEGGAAAAAAQGRAAEIFVIVDI